MAVDLIIVQPGVALVTHTVLSAILFSQTTLVLTTCFTYRTRALLTMLDLADADRGRELLLAKGTLGDVLFRSVLLVGFL